MVRIGRREALAAGLAGVTPAVAGCNILGSVTDQAPEARGPLELREFAFAAEAPSDDGEYTQQPEATYGASDTVWIYGEFGGLAGESVDDDRVQIDLREQLTIEGPGGNQVYDRVHTWGDTVDRSQLEGFFVQNRIGLTPDAPSGAYEVSAEFVDRVSETIASGSGTFHLED